MNPKEYNFKEYETNTVEKMVNEYGRGNIHTAILNMNAKIADLEMTIAGIKENANADWEKECGKLYDFLCEHKPYKNYPKGKLMDEYHKTTKN